MVEILAQTCFLSKKFQKLTDNHGYGPSYLPDFQNSNTGIIVHGKTRLKRQVEPKNEGEKWSYGPPTDAVDVKIQKKGKII